MSTPINEYNAATQDILDKAEKMEYYEDIYKMMHNDKNPYMIRVKESIKNVPDICFPGTTTCIDNLNKKLFYIATSKTK